MLENSENCYFGRLGRTLFKDLGPVLYLDRYISRYSLAQIVALVDHCVGVRAEEKLKVLKENRLAAFKNKEW